jgi:hypothetical protein
MLQVLSTLGLKIENGLDMVQASNDELLKLQTDFFDADDYKAHLTELAKVTPTTKGSLNKVTKLLNTWSTGIDKGLRDIRPYPRPELVTIATDMAAKATALSIVVDELYTKLPAGVTKKYKKDSKEYKEARTITAWIWKGFALGSGRPDGLSSLLKSIFEDNLEIHKAAENNSLYMDL